jgi:hypothetical protein
LPGATGHGAAFPLPNGCLEISSLGTHGSGIQRGLQKQENSLTETIGVKPTAAFDAVWGGGLMSSAEFTQLVYTDA